MENIVTEVSYGEKKIVKSIKKNSWKLISIVFAVLFLSTVAWTFYQNKSCITGAVISEDQAGEKLVDFISTSFGAEVSEYKDIKDLGDIYEVIVPYQGQEIPVYITKDGKYFISSAMEMSAVPALDVSQTQQASQPATTESYSTEDISKLKEFNQCLAQKGVKIYGANWCGYTQKWVETLGGFDAVTPIYVECTEETELCQTEGISGYPTTKINGKDYNNARTIEAIASETGCSAPVLNSSSSAATAAGSCG